MKPYGNQKPLVRYRFKDNMGCVFFKNFRTDREARMWYEQNKYGYYIKEFGRLGESFQYKILDSRR